MNCCRVTNRYSAVSQRRDRFRIKHTASEAVLDCACSMGSQRSETPCFGLSAAAKR